MNEHSAWGLLGHRAFRVLWLAGAIVNLAIWMQTVGAAWVMTTLSGSPLMVALVRDLARPSDYIESFAFDSWLDYLRQNSRRTQGEQRLQARLAPWQVYPSTRLRCELRTRSPLQVANQGGVKQVW